jgi:hypothetical protein
VGSDVDWTMLIDGQADIQHRAAAREVQRIVASTQFRGTPLKAPGAEGVFGNMAFTDGTFLHCREVSHRFDTTLRKICFEVDTPLREFTCEYGLF